MHQFRIALLREKLLGEDGDLRHGEVVGGTAEVLALLLVNEGDVHGSRAAAGEPRVGHSDPLGVDAHCPALREKRNGERWLRCARLRMHTRHLSGESRYYTQNYGENYPAS